MGEEEDTRGKENKAQVITFFCEIFSDYVPGIYQSLSKNILKNIPMT